MATWLGRRPPVTCGATLPLCIAGATSACKEEEEGIQLGVMRYGQEQITLLHSMRRRMEMKKWTGNGGLGGVVAAPC